MKMLKDILAGLIAVLTAGALMPRLVAETVSVDGGTITYTGATMTTVDGDVVLTFSNPEIAGSFSFTKENATTTVHAMARILAVGGGGAGGSIGTRVVTTVETGAAGGGGAGGYNDRKIVLDAGEHRVTVGAGAARAQSVVSSWVGGEGTATSLFTVDNNVTNLVVSVPGGGGGGSSKGLGGGMAGGSGGGGSWYGSALAGGTGVEGFGYAGGTPTAAAIGGGGGGAKGTGGANGTAGAGATSDITGVTATYATGGRGGRLNDTTYTAANGSVPGAGGDGAATTYGGAGADGILVVRISKVFEYVKVPTPTYLKSADFTNNTTYVAYDLEQETNATLKAAIKSITGVTSVTTSITTGDDGTTVTNGIGRHTFTVSLNDGYLWDIGTDGSAADCSCSWRIVEEGTIGLASVDITKNVSWTEGAKATIAIDVHMTPEMKKLSPKVLFIGSACGAHGFSSDVFNAAMNAITQFGSVDYYLFSAGAYNSTVSADSKFTTPSLSGHYDKGETASGTVSINGTALESMTGQHGTLYQFYEELSQIISAGTEYDYIIFSFDRGKIATMFPQAHASEAAVVAYIKQFYDKNAVIWMVDPAVSTETNENLPDGIIPYPWRPCPIVCGNSGDADYQTLDYYVANWGHDNQKSSPYGYLAYKAEVGLFNPDSYADMTETKYGASDTYVTTTYRYLTRTSTTTLERALSLQGTPCPYQALYNNAEDVADVISNAVSRKVFSAVLNDKVCTSMGLDIKATSGTWTTNESLIGWVPLTSAQLVPTDTGVKVQLDGLRDEAWIKLIIEVEDNGNFLNNQNATYNERTGKWEKDPNDGPVKVELTPDGETDTIVAEAEAKTSVAWQFNSCTVTATVRTGPETGTRIINGYDVDSLSISEGYSPEVVFNGKPGYVINYLEIDGQEITDYDPSISSWVFEKIASDHSVVVGYEKVDMKLVRAKQRYPWNNLVDIDYFIGGADLGKTSAVYGRLVFFVEYDGSDGTRVKKQLKTFRDNAQFFFNGPSADANDTARAAWPSGTAYDPISINDDAHATLRTPGLHRVTWDSNADGVAIFQKNSVKFTLYACPAATR